MAEASGAVQKVAVATTDDLWTGVRDSLRAKLSHETFETWFSLIEFHGIDHAERRLNLLAPNEVVRSWVTTSFSSLLEQTLVELSLPGYSIGWITEPKVSGGHWPVYRNQQPAVTFGIIQKLRCLIRILLVRCQVSA